MRKFADLQSIQVTVPCPWSLLVPILVNVGEVGVMTALALLLEAWLESSPQTQWQYDVKQITQFPRLGFIFCKTGKEWHHWELLGKSSGMALKPCSAQRQRAGLGAYCWLIRNLAWVETWETDTKLYLHSKGLQAWPVASCWEGLWVSAISCLLRVSLCICDSEPCPLIYANTVIHSK